MRIESLLSAEQCTSIGEKIVAFFHEHSRGDPFGWDWPTMWMLWPRKCAAFARLRVRYRALNPKP